MSGKFFKHLSDTESETEESEEEEVLMPTKTATQQAYKYSDDDDDVKRVVRTAKEKHYEELNDKIKSIRNYKKIKDIAKLLNSFEELMKIYQKTKTSVIDKEENGKVPKFYIKCLVELDDFIQNNWEDRKNMNKNNSKSLTTLRQKLRKYNKDFEQEINFYRENIDNNEYDDDGDNNQDDGNTNVDNDNLDDKYDSNDDNDDNNRNNNEFDNDDDNFIDDNDDTGSLNDRRNKIKNNLRRDYTAADDDDDDDDDESDWDMSTDEDESSSDDEDYGENLLKKFLKKDTDKEKEVKKREKKVKEVRKKKEPTQDEDGKWTTVEGGVTVPEKPKMFAKDQEINHQIMVKKLMEVMAMRGKKRVDRLDQMDMLMELLSISKQNNFGPALDVKILLGLQSALSDYGTANSMKLDTWKKYLKNMETIMELLEKYPDISIQESIQEDQESIQQSPYYVQGCLLTMLEKLDEEFVRLLQNCDPHSPEYVEKLCDETRLITIIKKARKYFQYNQRGTKSDLCRIYMLTIDYIYYKFDPNIVTINNNINNNNGNKENVHPKLIVSDLINDNDINDNDNDDELKLNSKQLIDRYCKYIYTNDDTVGNRLSKLASLSQVYYYALHDFWYEARDLMIMTGLPNTILSYKSDIQLQILYNRSLVQLGLCAFRHGFINDAHSSLLDILYKGRVRELLGQGASRSNMKAVERSLEQAKLEKRCQIPFHKHINLDLIECVYLVSSMLSEIPEVASNEFSVRKKLISRSFFNQLRKNEEQPLVGIPEAMREHVVAASKAMRIGNWKQCQEYILNDKMNSRVWNFFYNSDRVRSMLAQKIREESLRTYLFTYSFVYDSIAIDTLAKMFDLESNVVHSIISKMIINEELMASLDEPTFTVVMHRTEPSRIQSLALQLADKVNTLLDYNERLLELKLVPMGHFNQGQRFDRNFQNRQGNRQGGQNRQNRSGGGGGGNNQNYDRQQQNQRGGGGNRGGNNRRNRNDNRNNNDDNNNNNNNNNKRAERQESRE